MPRGAAAAEAIVMCRPQGVSALAAAQAALQKSGLMATPGTQHQQLYASASGRIEKAAPPEAAVEINGSRARQSLTRGITQQNIKRETGAAVITRGRFYQPGEVPTPGGESPLFLLVSAERQDQVDAAVALINRTMDAVDSGAAPPAAVDPNFRAPPPLQPAARQMFSHRC